MLLLSQINRSADRDGREPRLSDLRDSGTLEQDADVVILLHSGPENDPAASTALLKVIVGKQRNGPRDTIPVVFNKQRMRFDNCGVEESKIR